MSANKVRYPGQGCLVEFMQGNGPMQGIVVEEQGGRLRLYCVNRREVSLQSSRLLPWSGPNLSPAGAALSRQQMDEALEQRKMLRAAIADAVSPLDVWELTQGEVGKTSAEWLAGLLWEQPSIDHEAALGHALLNAKTHFRFSPPDFEIFTSVVVATRLAEAEAARVREAFAVTGAQFFHKLWDVHCHKRGPVSPFDEPEAELAAQLKEQLLYRIADPDGCSGAYGDNAGESKPDGAVWKLLTKGLPDLPHMALNLAIAWGLVPEHYNFWLDRAGYERGERWADVFADECAGILRRLQETMELLEPDPTPYISADPAGTLDRDDAFFVERLEDGGFHARIALACPALVWPFGGSLDKAALNRHSSLYLPEGDEHMLPERIGRGICGLDEGKQRPVLRLDLRLDAGGALLSAEPGLYAAAARANLSMEQCEKELAAERADSPASQPLAAALALSRLLQERRIANGAVITERPDPEVVIKQGKNGVAVDIVQGAQTPLSHLIVSELMILCNSALASWCRERAIPLLYRTQDVALPREFAGVWTEPHDISRVVRALPPASLEAAPKRHAGLGLGAYATFSSPIRRYVDLLNQGQIVSFLRNASPRLDQAAAALLLPLLSARGDAVSQVQRLRPRYWKLLFFRQQGDKQWWDAVVADENDAFVTISLPWAQLLVRGKRRQFDEKIYPGIPVQVRLGKVHPLLGEIQVVETREA